MESTLPCLVCEHPGVFVSVQQRLRAFRQCASICNHNVLLCTILACNTKPLGINRPPLYTLAFAVTGTEVAVKVRHPGVVRSIQRDFALMLQAAKLATVIPAVRKLRPEETLAQFAAPLQEQVTTAWLTKCSTTVIAQAQQDLYIRVIRLYVGSQHML